MPDRQGIKIFPCRKMEQCKKNFFFKKGLLKIATRDGSEGGCFLILTITAEARYFATAKWARVL